MVTQENRLFMISTQEIIEKIENRIKQFELSLESLQYNSRKVQLDNQERIYAYNAILTELNGLLYSIHYANGPQK